MASITENTYNSRLFKAGMRKRLHMARFNWLNKKLTEMGVTYDSVVELGCFDAKSISFLPRLPDVYLGVDANWENGLTLARKSWPNYNFLECMDPAIIPEDATFDIGITQETLEHIDPVLIPAYLKKLSDIVDKYVFITIPNETGIVFFLKQLYKITQGQGMYTFPEFVNQTLGRVHLVEREIGGHKGFSHVHMLNEIQKHFNIVDIDNVQTGLLPSFCALTVGIVAEKKIAAKYD